MIFLRHPSRPSLRVVQLNCKDSRTYILERLDAVLDSLASRYRIRYERADTYLGHPLRQCTVFEHDGVFKIIDWDDRDRPEKTRIAAVLPDPRCQFVLKCQYNPRWRVPKVRPFFYFEKTKPREFSASLPRLRAVPKVGNKLYWRGNLHMGREAVLSQLDDLLNEDWRETTDLESFYTELASHKMAISLPGLGKSCHREFECFAIGTAVVAPVFQNVCHMPLIPDYHYLACGPSAEEIRSRVLRATSEEIERVARNAMSYYDAYVRFESSVALLPHLLEL